MSLTPRQKELVEAAMRLLDKKGIHGFTMRSLAGEIGLSPMAAYKHFENQRELQLELWRACIYSLRAAMFTSEEFEACDNGRDCMLAVVRSFMEHALAHPYRFELLFHHPFIAEVWVQEDIDSLRQTVWDRTRQQIVIGQEDGSVSSKQSADALMGIVYACTHGGCYLLTTGRLQKQTGFSADQFIELTVAHVRTLLTVG